ncbi:tape measure protein [Agrobacterium vitis]
MRFAMIFEGVDRATKVMAKIMAAEKATAAASASNSKKSATAADAATKATEKQATAVGKTSSAFQAMGSAAKGAFSAVRSGAQSAFGAVANSAKAASRAVQALHRQTIQLAKSGFSQVATGGQKAFRGVALAGSIGAAAAVTSFGVAAGAATSMVDVAAQFEKFQTILETTEGSSAKAKTAMAWVAEFAAKTPYELSEVNEAFVQLRTRGLDPTKGLLKTLGDTSAAMGTPLKQAVEAVADAVTGENERLKEFGIVASKTGNKITYEYTNAAGKTVKASAKATDRVAIQATLMKIWSEKFGGAMEKLSSTWTGMMSNLADLWSQFQLGVMNAGLFDWMRGKLKFLLDTLNQMKADGSFDAWAKKISENIISVFEGAWYFAKGVWETFEKLKTYLTAASDYVGGWENLAAILGALVFAPALISTAAGLVQIAIGLSMLSAALMANPIILIVAAIVAAAVAIYVYWQPIKAFFVDLWSSISAGASAAWTAIKAWLGFDPVAALSSAWSSVASVVSNAWDALPHLSWDEVIAALDWVSWIFPLRWLDFIPGFSWAGIISGALDWGRYIVGLDWTRYLPTFKWPDLPSFNWPDIPKLELPSLPDVAGWIGAFGDKAMVAIEAVSSRLGGAWSKVKSAFSFGDQEAKVAVTDPATINATAAATAALKTDMQAVAAIDTSAAMEKLQAVDAAAKAILPAVTAAIRQTEAFLAGVSFYNQGASLMDTMAAGIRARSAVAVAEIAKVAQTMRDHLPSSPAKIGPLSDIHRLKFGETIAGSIRAEPMVKAMRTAALATMGAAAITAPPMAAPNITSATVAPASAASPVSSQSQSEVARSQIARMSLQAAPQSASAAAPVTLQFSPTLTIPAQAGQGTDMKAEFDKMMRDSARQLADLLDEEQRRRARRNV